MKVLILVFILSVVNYSKQQTAPQFSERVEATADECVKTTGVDPKLTEQAFEEGKFVEDDKFKCFLKCMLVKMGDMTEDGQLQPEEMKKQVPPGVNPEQASKLIETCKGATGSDPCDTAFKAAKCLVDEAIKLFASG